MTRVIFLYIRMRFHWVYCQRLLQRAVYLIIYLYRFSMTRSFIRKSFTPVLRFYRQLRNGRIIVSWYFYDIFSIGIFPNIALSAVTPLARALAVNYRLRYPISFALIFDPLNFMRVSNTVRRYVARTSMFVGWRNVNANDFATLKWRPTIFTIVERKYTRRLSGTFLASDRSLIFPNVLLHASHYCNSSGGCRDIVRERTPGLFASESDYVGCNLDCLIATIKAIRMAALFSIAERDWWFSNIVLQRPFNNVIMSTQ